MRLFQYKNAKKNYNICPIWFVHKKIINKKGLSEFPHLT